MDVPDGIRPYVGFRLWYFYPSNPEEERLRALYKTAAYWDASGVTRARCVPTPGDVKHKKVPPCEASPNIKCIYGCGLHAYHSLEQLGRAHKFDGPTHSGKPIVVGVTLGWGEMVRHQEQGWRAQFAKPVAFLKPRVRPGFMRQHEARIFVPTVLESAKLLGARVFQDAEEMQDWALSQPGWAIWTPEWKQEMSKNKKEA